MPWRWQASYSCTSQLLVCCGVQLLVLLLTNQLSRPSNCNGSWAITTRATATPDATRMQAPALETADFAGFSGFKLALGGSPAATSIWYQAAHVKLPSSCALSPRSSPWLPSPPRGPSCTASCSRSRGCCVRPSPAVCHAPASYSNCCCFRLSLAACWHRRIVHQPLAAPGASSA